MWTAANFIIEGRRLCTVAMSAKIEMNDDEAFSFYGVENRLLLHMCEKKRLNPFFRLHEVSDVLNKYVM